MFPSASESLPSRTQKKLFAFSGSSVANGASTSESTQRLEPDAVGDVQNLLDEDLGAADDRTQRHEELQHDGRHGRRIAAGRVEDQRPQLLLRLDVPSFGRPVAPRAALAATVACSSGRDEVGVLGMPVEIGANERADRHEREAPPADVLERTGDESGADALSSMPGSTSVWTSVSSPGGPDSAW